MNKIKVLDHGYIGLFEHMGSDLSIVRNARVSYDAEWRTGEDAGKDSKLLKYLLDNNHTSPFEAVTFTFDIKCPIFVARQWHRHRTWCIAGDTPIIFERPCDGKSYPKSLEGVVKSFRDPAQRERLSGMRLRAPGGSVKILDAWHSGCKKVYALRTKYGEVSASKDHVFKTPDGPSRLGDSPKYVMAFARVGAAKEWGTPDYTPSEVAQERWVEFLDGYEVSDLGRVRSYWGQGARKKAAKPFFKRITVNNVGRSVVGVKSFCLQVSRLVAGAFIGDIGEWQVLHKNDNPRDNRVSNLYLGSAADNSNDQYFNGGRVRGREVPVEVLDIKAAGMQETYDLTVTGDHWFTANNLVVHNSYNEISARYAQLPAEYYLPDASQITTQSKSSKQARTTEQHHAADAWRTSFDEHCRLAFEAYEAALRDGVPRELARSVLPMATYTHFFGTVNLLNLIKFLRLRLHPHAQWEIRQYAYAILELITPVVPVTMGHLQASLQEIIKG